MREAYNFSALYEAADLLEQIGIMIKDDPQELSNIASGNKLQRDSIAYYFIHIANSLRKEEDNATKDGQG